MDWFIKIANNLDNGESMKNKMVSLIKSINKLRKQAATYGPNSVVERWRGQIRDEILKLPSVTVIERMSWYELKELENQVHAITNKMDKYSISRWKNIFGE